MSWFEFRCAMKAFEDNVLHDYYVMRSHASLVISPHVASKDKHKIIPTKLFPMPSDVDKELLSPDKVQEIMKRAERAWQR